MTHPTDPADPSEPGALATFDLIFDRRTVLLVVAGFSTILLGALVWLIPTSWVIMRPGPVVDTIGDREGGPLITIEGRESFPAEGRLDLTTVSILGGPERGAGLVDIAWAWLRDAQAVAPVEALYPPDLTEEEEDQQNQAEMASSQELATAAALNELGIRYQTTLVINGLVDGTPAADVFERGDVILAVDDRPVADLDDLKAGIEAAGVDQPITVRVRRGERPLDVATRTFSDHGEAVLGVFLRSEFRFPFQVKINIGDIGGPSAGTMLALGILDLLTEGDLTGGEHIAGTGTIDATGQVGPIGGIQQKLHGAEREGADWFLAPEDNCPEVRGQVPDGLRVTKIGTLAEARHAVAEIAAGRGAALPPC